jgi:M6 family metalloprotease-like protein
VRGRYLIVGLLVVCVLAAGAPGYGALLKITRPVADVASRKLADLRAGRWQNAPFRDMPSRRELVRSSRKLPPGLAPISQDVLRVCAIRVEFASVPDPAKISGNGGRFELADQRASVFIDPAPHNRKFYLKHMEALANYYEAMSYGKLKMEWEVFPLENDGAYVLPDVGTYNPAGTVGSWDWPNLERFVKDAIRAADKDEHLKFSDFDAFVIIHAGSDWQNDLKGDSPYDIPSFFISLGDSIAVDDSTYFVVDSSVIPETSSQDGYLNGINGVLAHEMGHQLGLPDLYDTQSSMSVLGYWDLMDFGSGVGVVLADPRSQEPFFVTGVVPGSLSAWSKTFLGWVEPGIAEDKRTYTLDATELQEGFPSRQALVVPVNSYEYYIIENRQNDLDGDGAGILLADPGPDSTGVVMGPVNQNREFNYEYDWVLPGAGLLVWHIDGIMVRYFIQSDLVNGFSGRRGVSLVEADGIPDLGDFNSFYFLGSPFDPFFEGNNNRFGDDTYPSSTSGTGCHSHITIGGISGLSNSMNLTVSYDWSKQGFPRALGDSLRFGVPSVLVTDATGDRPGRVSAALVRASFKDSLEVVGADTIQVQYVDYSTSEIHAFEYATEGGLKAVAGWPRRLHGAHPRELVAADLDHDSRLETVAADETGCLYAFTQDGSPYFASSDSLGAFAHFGGGVNGVPVAYDLDGDGSEEILFGTDSALVALSGTNGVCDTVFLVRSPGGFGQPVIIGPPYAAEPEVIAYRTGELDVLSAQGLGIRQLPVACNAAPGKVFLAAADLDREVIPSLEILVAASDGKVCAVHADSGVVSGWGRKVCDEIVGPPSLADINGDGYLEVILTDRNVKTRAFLHNGSRLEGWPEDWNGCGLQRWDYGMFGPDTTITLPSAVIADLGSTGRFGIFQGSLFECIVGWEAGGNRLSGFPATLGGGCSSLAAGDIDGDGRLELVAGGGDGNLYAYSPEAVGDTCMGAPWRAAYFDGSRNCVYPASQLPPVTPPGTRLLVADTFHAFPNPVSSDVVTFSFVSETGGRARVEVFDLAGAKVAASDFEAAGAAKAEEPMDIARLANGLYVCKLRIEGNGQSATGFFKLAIKR